MAKGKSIKVDYKGIKVKYEDNELKGIIEVTDEETGEVLTSDINLTVEIKDLLASLNEDEKISINVKKFKAMTSKDKQQIFKYTCGCGKEIKSKYDELHIRCNDCDEDFVMEIKE